MENLESIAHVETIIIDEVSMMRTDLLELMDLILKEARILRNIKIMNMFDPREQLPFGGYQLIFVGDFLQLPPVINKKEKVPVKWIFQHDLFIKARFKIFNLTEVKRTSDPFFATNLNKLRVGYYDDETLSMIKKREGASLSCEGTVLMSRISGVDFYNKERLNSHSGDLIVLTGNMAVRDEIKDNEKLIKHSYRTALSESGLDKNIDVKVGCRIMLLANNPAMNYSNGSQGIVLGTKNFDELNNIFKSLKGNEYYLEYKYFGECLHVLLDTGDDVVVPKKAFPVYGSEFDDKGKRKIDLTYFQYPVTLGYAVSIHKSQGMSLDNMILDCDSIFSDNQFYVGISRSRSLAGLSILNFKTYYIRSDQDAVDFYIKISSMRAGEVYGE
jgi:hypothetical protein